MQLINESAGKYKQFTVYFVALVYTVSVGSLDFRANSRIYFSSKWRQLMELFNCLAERSDYFERDFKPILNNSTDFE